MKLISHRGNLRGPIPNKENRPSYIDCAISLGFDVEIDVRVFEGELYLGHDTPDYKVTLDWLKLRRDSLWLHCKDLEAVKVISKSNLNFFCHEGDEFTIVSNKKIWLHNLKLKADKDTIIPLLNETQLKLHNNLLHNVYGVCSDYVYTIK